MTKPSSTPGKKPPQPPTSKWDLLLRLTKSAILLILLLSISLLILSIFLSPSISTTTSPHWFTPSFKPTTTSCHPPNSTSTTPTTLSHLFFSLTASSKTWSTRRRYSHHWYHPNTTRATAWLDHPLPHNFTHSPSSPPHRLSTLNPSDFRASDRMARVIKDTFTTLHHHDIRWFVMGDDDTLFFPHNLATVLSKYDHRLMYYVGGSSESVEQDVMHGYDTAFGGGGFAVSYPLACQLVRILDGCIRRYHSFYGSDEKVAACVAELGVPLTREPGFHQLDIRGDPYGFLAAHPVAPLVSLHHLDSVSSLFPGETQEDSLRRLMHAYSVDPGHILQQSFCYDHRRKWSVSISWGYTVQVYPSLIASRVLSIPLQTFRTWRSGTDGPFVFNTRPLEADPCKRPIIYFLDQVEEIGEGRTVTTYKRVASASASAGKKCNQTVYKYASTVEKITVSASKNSPEKWMKAPRRECCEIADSWSLKRNMQVKIRSCEAGETISM